MTEDRPPDLGASVQGISTPIVTSIGEPIANDENRTLRLQQDIRTGERWLIAISAIGVTLNLAIALIYYGQLKEMRKATKESARSAYAACENAQIARSTLLEIQSGRGDTHDVANASIYQAMAATQSESAAMTPYLDPVHLQVNEDIGVPLLFKNSGRTVAKNVHAKVRTVFLSRDSDPDFTHPALQTTHMQIGRMYPGATSHTGDLSKPPAVPVKNTDGSTVKAQAADISDYQNGLKDAITYGTITYADIFGVEHWSRFCTASQVFKAGTVKDTGHTKCAAYNQEDSNHAIYHVSPAAPQPAALPEVSCVKPKDD